MKIVIAGAGDMGSHLAKMLSGNGHDITVADPDAKALVEVKGLSLGISKIIRHIQFCRASGRMFEKVLVELVIVHHTGLGIIILLIELVPHS